MSRYSKPMLLVIAVASLIACHIDPNVNVGGGNPPRFFFNSNTVTSDLLVYRVRPEYLHKNLPGEVFKDDNPDMQWIIRGEHNWSDPITYGVVPSGMREIVKAKPLVEGERYFVTASEVGQYFVIENGQAREVH